MNCRIYCLFYCLLTALPLSAAETPPDFLWARRAGGSDVDSGNAIAVDGTGNVVVAGFFRGTISFDATQLVSAGEDDAFVAKYDAAGVFQWARRAGGTAFDEARAIAVDPAGNVLVAGLFQGTAGFGTTNLTSRGESDVFLAKYSPDGDLLWARKAGGSSFDEAHGLALDAGGDAYLTGAVTGAATFGATSVPAIGGSNNVFVAKYTSAGNFQWVRRAGGDSDDQGNAVSVDAATNVWVTGRFAGSFTIGSATFAGAGTTRAFDVFVAKYDRAGNFLWARSAGGTGDDKANAIVTDAAGNAYVAGQITGAATFGSTNVTGSGLDIFLARFGANGDVLWVRKAGGNNAIYGDGGFGLALDPSGSPCLAGYFSGTGNFGTTNIATTGFDDLFVSKYNPAGSLLWVRRAGGLNLDISYALAADPAGNLYATGFFSDTATFGATSLPASGASPARDIFVAKLGAVTPPRLALGWQANRVEISWPASTTDFVLESTPTLPASSWTPLSEPATLVGDSRIVILTNRTAREFFRLRR